MTRFRIYFDKDEETRWLNRMAKNGYAMDNFFLGFYQFSPCEKGEWQYQIDIGHGFCGVNDNYADFMEEMGVEIVQSWGPWVILRRKAAEGPFELFSDVDSRIEQYKKILLMFKLVFVIEFFCLALEVYGGVRGSAMAWVAACLIAAVVVVFSNMIIRTKKKIYELQEQKGEAPPEYNRQQVSLLISMGFLINAVNLILQDAIPLPLRYIMLGLSIGLILFGSFKTALRK
ncbi:MAG: DUF2812 domain-containing protein [Lachnospiraceae bacterium]|nr:DUF2812 domain-containing protein [Lachnospiraceae bacterium]